MKDKEINPYHNINEINNANNKWSVLSSLADKYEEMTRSRVDNLKANLREKPSLSYEYRERQVNVSPTLARKICRVALAAMGMTSRTSNSRQEREAMSVALHEYNKEEKERASETERQLAEKEANRLMKRAEEERATAEKEKKLKEEMLINSIAVNHQISNNEKIRGFRRERVQEIVERELNSKIMKIDNLEEELLSENPGIGKREIKYGEGDITVYDLNGLPFSMLTHAVDYHGTEVDGKGTETAKKILENPTIWTEDLYEAKKDPGFAQRGSNTRGNTISTSYTNSEHNLETRFVGNKLTYGFDHIDADSIISVINGDGATANMAGERKTTVTNVKIIKDLENSPAIGYNEILLRRYSENGYPKKPDYIVVQDDKISEEAMKHAEYFKIPIVNINLQAYDRLK